MRPREWLLPGRRYLVQIPADHVLDRMGALQGSACGLLMDTQSMTRARRSMKTTNIAMKIWCPAKIRGRLANGSAIGWERDKGNKTTVGYPALCALAQDDSSTGSMSNEYYLCRDHDTLRFNPMSTIFCHDPLRFDPLWGHIYLCMCNVAFLFHGMVELWLPTSC